MLVVCWQPGRFLLLVASIATGCAPTPDSADQSNTQAVSLGENVSAPPEDQNLLEESSVSTTGSMTGSEYRGERLVIKGAVRDVDRSGNTATLSLDCEVDAGWHIYAMGAPAGVNQPTVVDVHLPPNVVFDSDWNLPQPEIQFSEFGMQSMYTGKFQMTRSVTISSCQENIEINLEVSYQACSRHQCLPPSKTALVVPIPSKQRM